MITRTPRTYADAVANAAPHYVGPPCKHGHDGWRYTKGRTCIEFVRISRGGWNKSGRRTAANMTLALEAKNCARTTYMANKPCRHGHLERYIATNHCVECARRANERRKIKTKFWRIRAEYGLARDDYLAMVASQGSACRICRRYQPDHFKLHIDHCHDTGQVRGLLCGPCNQGIGLLRHSTERLELAIEYLRETSS
jgi:hypothetical protein